MSLLSDLAKIQRLLAYREELGKNVEPSAFVQDLIEDKIQRNALGEFFGDHSSQDPSLLKVGGRRAVFDLGDNVGKIDLIADGPLIPSEPLETMRRDIRRNPLLDQIVFPSGSRAEIFRKMKIPTLGPNTSNFYSGLQAGHLIDFEPYNRANDIVDNASNWDADWETKIMPVINNRKAEARRQDDTRNALRRLIISNWGVPIKMEPELGIDTVEPWLIGMRDWDLSRRVLLTKIKNRERPEVRDWY